MELFQFSVNYSVAYVCIIERVFQRIVRVFFFCGSQHTKDCFSMAGEICTHVFTYGGTDFAIRVDCWSARLQISSGAKTHAIVRWPAVSSTVVNITSFQLLLFLFVNLRIRRL